MTVTTGTSELIAASHTRARLASVSRISTPK
jgi:hypothetical protein